MQSIRKVVKNVIAESAEIGYDPETGTNWCHLPVEMRMKCIEAMEFKTRNRLQRTSKIEKSLVESKRYRFDRVTLSHDKNGIDVTAKNKLRTSGQYIEIRSIKSQSREKKLECALQVLKNCDIRSFNFVNISNDSARLDSSVIERISECAPFGFKRFSTQSDDSAAVKMFLRNCGVLERITFHSGVEFLGELMEIPSVVHAKDFRIVERDQLDPMWKLIEQWIKADVEVGTTLQFLGEDTVSSFLSKFADRVIENKNNKTIRIRTDNQSKEILLVQIGSDETGGDYILCKVIPVGLPESDYRNGDKWIDGMFEASRLDDFDHHLLDSDEGEICEIEEMDADLIYTDSYTAPNFSFL